MQHIAEIRRSSYEGWVETTTTMNRTISRAFNSLLRQLNVNILLWET